MAPKAWLVRFRRKVKLPNERIFPFSDDGPAFRAFKAAGYSAETSKFSTDVVRDDLKRLALTFVAGRMPSNVTVLRDFRTELEKFRLSVIRFTKAYQRIDAVHRAISDHWEFEKLHAMKLWLNEIVPVLDTIKEEEAGSGRDADRPLVDLMIDLARVFTRATGAKLPRSRTEGPFVRFVLAFDDELPAAEASLFKIVNIENAMVRLLDVWSE